MSETRIQSSHLDALTNIIYGKRVADDSTGYPILVDSLGNLKSTIIQSAVLSSENSSTTNLSKSPDSGYTFTGTAVSTLIGNAIQVSLKTDQNCIVYVDQSPDGTNWDLSDSYNYYSNINNFGVTVQAINSYVRVRVVNQSTVAATTYFRLQTVLCPIVEALPRSLDSFGNLKVGIQSMTDQYGFRVENTPTDEMRVVNPVRLVGASFIGTTLDTNFWTATTVGTGSITQGNCQIILATGSTTNSTTAIQSVRNARYIGGATNRYRAVIRLPDTGTASNNRRWGMFTTTDGAFFDLGGTTLSVGTRKGSTDALVASGSWNGVPFILDTNVHTYEIYFTNSKVFFVIDGLLRHTVTASTATWTDTTNLPIRAHNNNSGGSTSNVSLEIRVNTIFRLGELSTQSMYKFQSGTTAGLVLKYGAGNLHGLIVSAVTQNSVITLYDNTAASGTTIWASGQMGAQTQPFELEFHDIPYSTGLTLAITGANCNVLVAYE